MNKINLPISDKDAIRAEVKQRISLLSEKEKNEVALSLCEKLCNLTIVQEAQNIIGYQALSDEISLTPFLEAVKKQGKNIIIIDSSGHISPLPSEGIILVPGRAFTICGKRIGRGGGCYDRILQKYPGLYTVGVCFECQIFPELPQDKWDISLNTVIYSGPQRGQ